ncbi:MAG: YesL family protein [Bifidobacterium psychraerophilum]|uniref:YesL family protein n=1 Tax=Bifidobacterium psychraerophilum TaxID=218140 RepID=UPI0039ED513E
MKRFALGYEYIARIIMMLVVVNIAAIVHAVMGLVLGGLFPSIAAAHATYRAWIIDVHDRSWTIRRTWTVFHRAWKAEFAAANAFGWVQCIIWALLVWEYWFVQSNDLGTPGVVVSGILLVVNIVYALFVFVSWAIRSNFTEGNWWIARTSLSMIVARPLCSLLILVLLLITAVAYYKWPGLLAAFGLSIPIFTTMMAVYSFGKIPGMDVHDIEPIEKDQRKRQADTRH